MPFQNKKGHAFEEFGQSVDRRCRRTAESGASGGRRRQRSLWRRQGTGDGRHTIVPPAKRYEGLRSRPTVNSIYLDGRKKVRRGALYKSRDGAAAEVAGKRRQPVRFRPTASGSIPRRIAVRTSRFNARNADGSGSGNRPAREAEFFNPVGRHGRRRERHRVPAEVRSAGFTRKLSK